MVEDVLGVTVMGITVVVLLTVTVTLIREDELAEAEAVSVEEPVDDSDDPEDVDAVVVCAAARRGEASVRRSTEAESESIVLLGSVVKRECEEFKTNYLRLLKEIRSAGRSTGPAQ